MFADIGLGTHSYSKLAFAIPTDIVTRFRGHVGIDRITQGGGCVRVKILRGIVGGDDVDAYQSGHLLGTADQTAFDINDFTKCDRILLETSFGDEGRPVGADPFDIRDDVSWMLTLLTIDVAAVKSRAWWGLQQYDPQLANWTISENFKSQVTVSAYWNAVEGRWMHGLSWKTPVATVVGTPIMEFTQKVVLTLNNSWVTVSGASDGIGDKTATVRVTVNDEPVVSARSGDVNLKGQVGSFDMNHWALGALLGEEVEIKVQIMPREAGTYKPQGFTIGALGLQPLITGLPGGETLPIPDVALTALEPLSFKLPGYPEMPAVGILRDEIPLQTGGLLITDGYVFPGAGELVYRIQPDYEQFAMIIGRDQTTQLSFGPCEILIDDELVWTSKELFAERDMQDQQKDRPEGIFIVSSRSAYIRIPIPSGHASLTIRNSADLGFIGNAGFNKK
jgi:hypothetical protein